VLRRLGIPALFFINTAPLAEGRVLSVHKVQMLRTQRSSAELLELLRRKARDRKIALGAGVDGTLARAQYPYDTEEAARLKYLLNATLDWRQRDLLVEDCFAEVHGGQEAEISRHLYMDREQVRELARAGCIGSHSHEHLPLGLLRPETAGEQIRTATRHLEAWTGMRPFALSYPYGSQGACSPAVARLAAADGFDYAFTMERAGNRELGHPLHLARFDCNDVPGGKACTTDAGRFAASLPPAAWYRN
jgi:peptidoglycan/xylan/chitin deacetylase (PgdA/CDA1 family)